MIIFKMFVELYVTSDIFNMPLGVLIISLQISGKDFAFINEMMA